MKIPPVCHLFRGRLIVSCQAPEGDVFRDSDSMARFAKAAIEGGAAAIRADGPYDIRAIRAITDAPILGIQKSILDDGRILITPSFEAARALVEAGANLVALDVTVRGQRYGALDRIREIKEKLRVPVLADIATLDEAVAAVDAGADAVLSTMRGYTAETAHILEFEPNFIGQLACTLDVPVIAEGRIQTPEHARHAIAAGAFSVVVGTAITRPREIVRTFSQAIERQAEIRTGRKVFLGIDLGGTNTKFGLVEPNGTLLGEGHVPTPAQAGRTALLHHLQQVAQTVCERARHGKVEIHSVGIATAGWVDANTGAIAYATDNLPGWTGAPVAGFLQSKLKLPVVVENDANALAAAEKHFGAGRPFHHFAALTLGTGVGGGCYVAGELNRGAHFFANAFGHIPVVPDGEPCSCGGRGCLEAYANLSALLRYADGQFSSAEELIHAAADGDPKAVGAIGVYGRYLARGCSTIVQLFDPEALIFSGGISQNNNLLLGTVQEALARMVPAWTARRLSVLASPLGYYGGVLGAAAIAIEKAYR